MREGRFNAGYENFRSIVEIECSRPYRKPETEELMVTMFDKHGYVPAFQVSERLRRILSNDFPSDLIRSFEVSRFRLGGTAMSILRREPKYMAVSIMTSTMPYFVTLTFDREEGGIDDCGTIPLLIVNKDGDRYTISNVERERVIPYTEEEFWARTRIPFSAQI